MRLLISGSRQASPEMLQMAYSAVQRANSLGWSIVVGDADGVDKQVIYACCLNKVPFCFYGITDAPRNFCCMEHLNNYLQIYGDYLNRDRHMVRLADVGLFIWNGRSRGTKYTYDQMDESGKQCWLRDFSKREK